MNLTRPTFDAACASLSDTAAALLPEQCSALWQALVQPDVARRIGRVRWTPTATALRAPLLREMHTGHVQNMRRQFAGQVLTLPGRPPVDISQLHHLYLSRLNDILLRMDTALRNHGHWCTPDEASGAQPLRVIVANERAAMRFAGNADWTQWEDPSMVRRLTNVFAAFAASKNPIRGAQWQPYMPNGARKRGAAALTKQMREWHGAFHDAVRTPLVADPGISVPLHAFHEKLRSKPMQQVISDAIRTQCADHKGPRNAAFTGPGRSIWHALPVDTRVNLAAEFHDALSITYADHADAAYSPATTTNPFALTKEERAAVSAAA